ncbi:uncharacterized protein EDB91DRAFT_1243734 [Suillus paluster]|uniref:uncharacterized protein n=1 Tax=Suillus paluster TaxID=48578 RepID=UPI001B87ECC9|nr:uncharacterized protein EDB91DRAFT_1243734 [Suillus paluster]KAG1751473.1 hypothetical protein EDB91DRAFT_1243734 [Suillus paluster]
MSSTAPTHQALGNIVNNTDSAPSQHQCCECRPSEKALYQVEEDQERCEARRRPSGQDKTKATHKNCVDRGTQDSTQFSTQAITLSKGSVAANGPLDLWPWFSKVPPQAALSRTSGSGGWQEDALTKESGFVNREHRSNGFSSSAELHRRLSSGTPWTSVGLPLCPSEIKGTLSLEHDLNNLNFGALIIMLKLLPAPWKLTAARANELIRLQWAQSQGSLNNNIDLTDSEQYDNSEQYNDDDNPINHDVDESDVFTGGESNSYEDLRHLKRVQLPRSDDEGDSTQSHKRMHESKDSPSPQQVAWDYKVAVQQLIKFVISHFCVWLASEYAYPDCMTQVLWAKEACSSYEIEMGFNGKIIQMITCCTSHLTGEVKGKVRPLVKNIYGFESTNQESIKSRNRKLAHQLKDKFGLCYQDLGDKKNNVPHSGLFQSRLNQQAANLLWYCNKKDEGIAKCCIDEWYDGEWVDISFSSSKYREAYDRHLVNLKKFHTQMKDHRILDGILVELNNNGRLHAKVDPINVEDGDCLSDDRINNTIWEYQQVGGADDSDEVESDWESEGGQFEDDEVEAE